MYDDVTGMMLIKNPLIKLKTNGLMEVCNFTWISINNSSIIFLVN